MTAPLTRSGAHSCLRAAIAALVERMGVSCAAAEIGIDPSTIRRHLAGTPWSDAEIAGLIAFEVQESGRSSIVDVLAQSAHGNAPIGESTRLRADLIRGVALSGRLLQAEAEVHDSPTQRSLDNLQSLLDEQDCLDVQLRADIQAARART